MAKRPQRAGLAAWRAFLEAHHAVVEALGDELERAGLSLSMYDVLVHLIEAGGAGLRMADLAQRVLLSKSGLTRLVDRMALAGLVTRQPSTADARVVHVVPTPAGIATFRRISPTHLRGVARHFTSMLSPEETVVITTTMGRLVQAASAANAGQREP
jgi:DNA-binding MarR family transcriptional regulator